MLPTTVEGDKSGRRRSALVAVKTAEMKTLAKVPDGTEITISGTTAEDDRQTRNVVGVLRGSDPTLKAQYLMFSAHMDHLGVCAKNGDTICNGADDDASGTATVLELARIFSSGPRPKRSVVFVTFGSEELGLLGSRGMAAEPPFPLSSVVAEIEFEQTALPEAKVGGKEFWMTGSQLSDLRTLLVQHGSQLADDPFPGNPFFRASDNYSFAEKGVVAHTMSGAAEFPDYHQPGDEAQKLNYDFLANSLQAVLPGLEWLANNAEQPEYAAGKNPAEKK
jgi:Zn-dependent M28 family amino/carboxypeptidase